MDYGINAFGETATIEYHNLPTPKLKAGQTWCEFEPPKPCCFHFHYSNPDSQGALIAETDHFPGGFIREEQECHSTYSDRMFSAHPKQMKKAVEYIGRGEQAWGCILPSVSDEKLREFARLFHGLKVAPTHVRVVHHFNVSSGYSCPVVVAVTEKS